MKSFRIGRFSGQHFPSEIRRDKEYLSAFSPNARKYGPVKLNTDTFYIVRAAKSLSLE